jgi:hypothetical protein
MPTVRRTVLSCFIALALLALGCGKKESEPAPAAPSASAATVATFEPPPAASSAPVPAETAPPVAAAAPKPDASQIKACCAALHAAAEKAPPKDKSTVTNGAMACDGIAKLVAAGKTKHADAITSVHATMKGAALPAACK